ncbi:MAG: hypothetical protein LDLANPLL_01178 [Turneriella sp.]|nr:hypothetical protein [Turneriella sp.]
MLARYVFFLCLFLSVLLTACGKAQTTTVRGLAQEIAAGKNRLSQKTVAILLPETRGLSNEADALELTEKLTHEIVNSTDLRVVERSRLNQVLKESELGQSGVIDVHTAAKVGKILGVDAVILSVVTGKADSDEVYLRLVDSSTGEILKTAQGIIPRDAPRSNTNKSSREDSSPVEVLPGAGGGSRDIATGEIEAVDDVKGRLVDQSFRAMGAGGYAQHIGRIENVGKVPIYSVNVSLTHFDKQGGIIGTTYCMAPDRAIQPKEKLPFSCVFKPLPKYANHKAILNLQAGLHARRSNALLGTNLKFKKDTSSFMDGYVFSGKLTNRDTVTISFPKVLVSFFDAKNKFIGSAYGFTVLKKLKPRASSTFQINVYAYSLHGKPTRYEAFYSALRTN